MYVRSRPSLKALKSLNANRRLLKQEMATDTDPVAFDSIALYYLRYVRTVLLPMMVIVLLLVICSSDVAYVFFVWFGEVTRDALFCLLVRWLVMPCLFFFGPVAMAAL